MAAHAEATAGRRVGLARLGELFSSGWAFFVPYLAIYLGSLALNVTNGAARLGFMTLHVVLLVLFLSCVWDRGRREGWDVVFGRGSAWWFWVGLIVFLLAPGAYL